MIARECASVGGGGRAPNCCSGSNKSDKFESPRGGVLSLPLAVCLSLSLVNKLSCGRKRRPISRNWNIVAIGNCQETWLQVGPRVELHTHTSSLFFLFVCVCGYDCVLLLRACVCVCVKQVWKTNDLQQRRPPSLSPLRLRSLRKCRSACEHAPTHCFCCCCCCWYDYS